MGVENEAWMADEEFQTEVLEILVEEFLEFKNALELDVDIDEEALIFLDTVEEKGEWLTECKAKLVKAARELLENDPSKEDEIEALIEQNKQVERERNQNYRMRYALKYGQN